MFAIISVVSCEVKCILVDDIIIRIYGIVHQVLV